MQDLEQRERPLVIVERIRGRIVGKEEGHQLNLLSFRETNRYTKAAVTPAVSSTLQPGNNRERCALSIPPGSGCPKTSSFRRVAYCFAFSVSEEAANTLLPSAKVT